MDIIYLTLKRSNQIYCKTLSLKALREGSLRNEKSTLFHSIFAGTRKEFLKKFMICFRFKDLCRSFYRIRTWQIPIFDDTANLIFLYFAKQVKSL